MRRLLAIAKTRKVFLLSRPLSSAVAAHLAERIAACGLLSRRQRRVLLFALCTTNTDISTKVRSCPLNPHAWSGPAWETVWNKAHPPDDQLKCSYAVLALHNASEAGFFTTDLRPGSGRLIFPNPNVASMCTSGAGNNGCVITGKDGDALLATPLSAAAATAVCARVRSHPSIPPLARQMLIFALSTPNTDTSQPYRSTPVNKHAWTGASLVDAWNASQSGCLSAEHASKSLRIGARAGLFLAVPIKGASGGSHVFTFPNPRVHVVGGCTMPGAAALANDEGAAVAAAEEDATVFGGGGGPTGGGRLAVAGGDATDWPAGGIGAPSLLPAPLSAAASAAIAARVESHPLLQPRAWRVLLFALRTPSADTPLNAHA